ncbi:hypothetical protein D3C79_774090 [compost metagenome]
MFQAHLRQQALVHQGSKGTLLRACSQVAEQAQARVGIATLGATLGARLPVAEEIHDLLRRLYFIRELQRQAVGTVGAQLQHAGVPQWRPGQRRQVALCGGVQVQLAFGAGQGGEGGCVGFAQRADLEQRVAGHRRAFGLAGHAIVEIVGLAMGIHGHGHAGNALLVHQRANDLIDAGLQRVVGLCGCVAQGKCDGRSERSQAEAGHGQVLCWKVSVQRHRWGFRR